MATETVVGQKPTPGNPVIVKQEYDLGPKRKKFKLKANNETWKFIFEGTYMGKDKNITVEKSYKVHITMPDNQVQKGATSQFLKHYVPRLMPRIYKDFISILTFEITDAVCSDPRIQAENLDVMTRAQLLAYIAESELPVETELYADAADLCQAIKECVNPKTSETFERNQQIRKERMGDRLTDSVVALDYIDQSIADSKKALADDL
jgi:hypothetical protein